MNYLWMWTDISADGKRTTTWGPGWVLHDTPCKPCDEFGKRIEAEEAQREAGLKVEDEDVGGFVIKEPQPLPPGDYDDGSNIQFVEIWQDVPPDEPLDHA